MLQKPNDSSLHMTTPSNHAPQVIKQLPTSINERVCKNSSNETIFSASKYEYEKALKNSGYQQTELILDKKEQR